MVLQHFSKRMPEGWERAELTLFCSAIIPQAGREGKGLCQKHLLHGSELMHAGHTHGLGVLLLCPAKLHLGTKTPSQLDTCLFHLPPFSTVTSLKYQLHSCYIPIRICQIWNCIVKETIKGKSKIHKGFNAENTRLFPFLLLV